MKCSTSKASNREGSSSFLKKRTKKHLLSEARIDLACRISQQSKSLFCSSFQKELLPCSLLLEKAGSFV
jgi:hypothetical protein